MQSLNTFVKKIAQALVDNPEEIRLTGLHGERTAVMELRCHPKDVGKIIGKNGKTVGAIRTLLSTVAARQGRKAVLEVVE